jgi:Tfp pilus assembly protein PilE
MNVVSIILGVIAVIAVVMYNSLISKKNRNHSPTHQKWN